MQLENIATPQEEPTPELRYASLHRAVERGMASDEVLRELVEICLQLGHVDEALRVHASMKPGAVRELVTSRLVRKGILHADQHPGAHALAGLSSSDAPDVKEHVLDAVQFLCQAYMPAVALLTMLAFPIIVGVGGFLTAGGSLWLFAGLAAIPGLLVFGVVGAVGRRIFLDAAEGSTEMPPIPAPAAMIAAAKRHLLDFGTVYGVLLAPSLTALWFDLPLVSTLPGLALGMFVVPVALILRQLRGDIASLSPVLMVRAISASRGYSQVAAAYWLAYAPAAIAFWTTLGHAVWLQLAIVGPLAVLPTFLTARFLGTFAELHKERLQPLLKAVGTASKKAAAPAVATATVGAPAARSASAPRHTPLRRPASNSPTMGGIRHAGHAPARPAAQPAAPQRPLTKAPPAAAPNLPPRPASLTTKATLATPTPTPLGKVPPAHTATPTPQRSGPPPAQRLRQPSASPTASPAAARIEGRAPAAKPVTKAPANAQPAPAQPAPAAPKAAAPKPAAKKQPVPAVEPHKFAGPDLSGLPGARVISAEEREKLGAASRRP